MRKRLAVILGNETVEIGNICCLDGHDSMMLDLIETHVLALIQGRISVVSGRNTFYSACLREEPIDPQWIRCSARLRVSLGWEARNLEVVICDVGSGTEEVLGTLTWRKPIEGVGRDQIVCAIAARTERNLRILRISPEFSGELSVGAAHLYFETPAATSRGA